MSTDPKPADPAKIQRDIEETRERVDEVKHEAQKRVEYAKQNARENPQYPAIVLLGFVALIAFGVWRKWRC